MEQRMTHRLVDEIALAAWMDRHALGEGPISDVRRLGGGTQNIVFAFRRGAEEFVMRRPPLQHARAGANETLRREMRVLRALSGTDIPHPPLIAGADGEDVLGYVFYLMAPVAGINVGVGLPEPHASSTEIRAAMGPRAMDALVRIGRVDHLKPELAGFGRPDGFLERQVGRWRKELQSYAQTPSWPGPSGLPNVEQIGDWLEAHRPAAFMPGLMHGDFHASNLIYAADGPDVRAVVDWEMSTIGDPLIDLGWFIVTWPNETHNISTLNPDGFASADELIAHYAAQSQRDLSNIDWYITFAAFKLAIVLEGTFVRACAGQCDEATGDLLHRSAQKLLEGASLRVSG